VLINKNTLKGGLCREVINLEYQIESL